MPETIPPSRPGAVNAARAVIESGNLVYIDTETTGIDRTDEIVEITLVDDAGQVLVNRLVRPSRPIPPGAMAVHHITNEMVQTAQSWPTQWPTIRGYLLGKTIAAYNAPFDMRMMQQSLTNYRLPWKENFNSVDIMKLYAEYRGEWDPNRRSYRFFKLEEAGRFFKIDIPNAHRSTDDTLLARAVLHCIAGLPY